LHLGPRGANVIDVSLKLTDARELHLLLFFECVNLPLKAPHVIARSERLIGRWNKCHEARQKMLVESPKLVHFLPS
jgi:hypothetical protein